MKIKRNFLEVIMLLRFNKYFLISFFISISPIAHADVISVARGVDRIFKAGSYKKFSQIGSLTSKDLNYATKVENIEGILDLAAQENRIDSIQMLRYAKLYSSQNKGDLLLLKCLKVRGCNPESFIGIIKTSELHSEIVLRNPSLGIVQVHHAVGEVTENLANWYFQSSVWTKIPGQIGRQGFDGLFIKVEDGIIKDVMVVESKYNTSILQQTNHGTQMSDQWVRRKLYELKKKYPDDKTYEGIEKFVNAGTYRAIVWNMKVENGALKVGIGKVKSKDGNIAISSLAGSESQQLATPFVNNILIKKPKNKFEESFIKRYTSEIARY